MAKEKQQHDPDLLARLFSNLTLAVRLMFDRRVSGTAKLIPVAMLAYIISPLDLIPDVFLPLGIVDDITALVVGLQLFIHSAPPDVVQEYRQGGKKRRAAPDEEIANSEGVTIIEGEYTVRQDNRPRESQQDKR